MPVSLSHTTKTYPKLPYEKMAGAVLGNKYQLSLTFLGATRAKKLNQTTRRKSYTPNVLSFPLDKQHGEIYITLEVAKKEAREFNLTYPGYVGYLFIHGLLHLRGLNHGTKMELTEKKLMKQFALK